MRVPGFLPGNVADTAGDGGLVQRLSATFQTSVRLESEPAKRFRSLRTALASAGASFPWPRASLVVRSPGDLADFTNLDILGSVPNLANLARAQAGAEGLQEPGGRGFPLLLTPRRVRALSPNPTTDETYGQLLVQLHNMTERGLPGTLLVTSPNWKDGKSTTALNLALALASSGVATCLVDTNLRRPGLTCAFEKPINAGLARHLEGVSLPDPFEQPTAHENLFVITAGKSSEDPAMLLAGPSIEQLLLRLSERYRIVILDAGPVNDCSETPGLASRVDEVCLLIRARHTRLKDLERVVNRLAGQGVRQIHAILSAH